MKVSYRKIKTNIKWDESVLSVMCKEKLDACHVWLVLWCAHLKRNGIVDNEPFLPYGYGGK